MTLPMPLRILSQLCSVVWVAVGVLAGCDIMDPIQHAMVGVLAGCLLSKAVMSGCKTAKRRWKRNSHRGEYGSVYPLHNIGMHTSSLSGINYGIRNRIRAGIRTGLRNRKYTGMRVHASTHDNMPTSASTYPRCPPVILKTFLCSSAFPRDRAFGCPSQGIWQHPGGII